MSTYIYKLKRTVAVLLCVSVVVVGSYGVSAQKAYALEAVIEVGKNLVENTINAAANVFTSGAIQSLALKEYTLDGILYALKQLILNQLTAQLLQWLNTGMDGGPAFVQNLEQHLAQTTQITAEKFINGPATGAICSSLQGPVKIALELQAQAEIDASQGISCSASAFGGTGGGGVPTGKAFYSSWQNWFDLVLKPENNIYATMDIASRNMVSRVNSTQAYEAITISQGNGWLPDRTGGTECKYGAGENCQITTPGDVIEEGATKALGTGIDSLIAADEINEIISALLAQLLNQAITGLGGLFGMSQSSGEGGGSYLQELADPDQENVGIEYDTCKYLVTALEIETEFVGIQQNVIDEITDLEEAINAAGEQYGSCINTRLSTTLRNELTSRQARASTTYAVIAGLNDMNARCGTSPPPNEMYGIYLEFQELQAAGQLHTPVDSVAEQFEADDIITAVRSLQSQLDRDISQCIEEE